MFEVPILACGGDDSRVHLYVQESGQVSLSHYALRVSLVIRPLLITESEFVKFEANR